MIQNYGDNYLIHYGVLGMKWGVRRYQNADGSLTAAGKAKYRTESVAGNIGRAITNNSLGQRIYGVGLNKGFREDVKEISNIKKKKLEEINNSEKYSPDDRKKAKAELKNDVKKSIEEARVTASEILYPWQSKSLNEKIQTENMGKAAVKAMLMGSYGSLNYNRLSDRDVNKGVSFITGCLTSIPDMYIPGAVGAADYAYNYTNYKKQTHKE